MITIHKPIWNGGKRYIGIADYRVLQCGNIVEFECDYKNKEGVRIYPRPFKVPKFLVLHSPTHVLKPSGTRLYLVAEEVFNNPKITKAELTGTQQKTQQNKQGTLL